MSMTAAFLLLFLVMDPVGNIPFFLTTLKNVQPRRRGLVIIREHLIALAVLALFLLVGRYILSYFQIQEPALSMAGGIILFLIALNMIFKPQADMFGTETGGAPLVVPLAIPYIAGPSTLATLLLLSTREPGRWGEWLVALIGAWACSMVILLLAGVFSRILGPKVLVALECLMGMFLTVVAVQMFITGLARFMQSVRIM